jgi:hypothetical protein
MLNPKVELKTLQMLNYHLRIPQATNFHPKNIKLFLAFPKIK